MRTFIHALILGLLVSCGNGSGGSGTNESNVNGVYTSDISHEDSVIIWDLHTGEKVSVGDFTVVTGGFWRGKITDNGNRVWKLVFNLDGFKRGETLEVRMIPPDGSQAKLEMLYIQENGMELVLSNGDQILEKRNPFKFPGK